MSYLHFSQSFHSDKTIAQSGDQFSGTKQAITQGRHILPAAPREPPSESATFGSSGGAALQKIESLLRPQVAFEGEIEDAVEQGGLREAECREDLVAFLTVRFSEELRRTE